MNALLFLQTPILPRRPFGQPAGVDTGVDPMAYEWLHLGVRAALDSNREDARYYFVQAVRTDLNFARAWLYLGGVADDPALTLSCVQKVLQIDPGEAQARTALLWARTKLGLPPVLPVWELAPVTPSPLPGRAAIPPSAAAALPWKNGESRGQSDAPARSLQWGGLSPARGPAPAAPIPPAVERKAEQPVVPYPPSDVIWDTLLPPRTADPREAARAASPVPVPPVPPWPFLPPLPTALPLPELPPLPPPLRSSAPSAQLAMPLLINPPVPQHSSAPSPTAARAPLPSRPPLPAALPLDDVRSGSGDLDSNRLVQRGVQSAALGNRARARYYFLKAIAADAGNTRAWLYLGGVAGDPSLTLACLERVLRVEPWNREARAGAEWAVSQLGISSPALLWWK